MNPKKYLSEAVHELHQVKWPTKNHAVKISIITGIFVVASTVIIAAVDLGISQLLFLGKTSTTEVTDPAVNVGDISATTSDGIPIQISTEGSASTSPITITDESPENPDASLSPEQ